MEPNATDRIDELDVEAFAAANDAACHKPRARHYLIRIDRERVRTKEECLTGAEILALVNKTPESHKLFQRLRGGENRPVGPCDKVCFTEPGIERFMTIPCDATEGEEHG